MGEFDQRFIWGAVFVLLLGGAALSTFRWRRYR
jgi:hypothetical protein